MPLADASLVACLPLQSPHEAAARTHARTPDSTPAASASLNVDNIIRDIARSLAHLHECGLSYGNLDESNVVLFHDKWKLIDMDMCTELNDAYCYPSYPSYSSMHRYTTIHHHTLPYTHVIAY